MASTRRLVRRSPASAEPVRTLSGADAAAPVPVEDQPSDASPVGADGGAPGTSPNLDTPVAEVSGERSPAAATPVLTPLIAPVDDPVPAPVVDTAGGDPEPTASADRHRYPTAVRGVDPDPSKARFLDAGSKRPSRRQRRRHLNAGGMFFTSRDRELVELVIAYGWLSRAQLGDLMGVTAEAVRQRAVRLVDFGLLGGADRGYNGEVIYTPTPAGMRLVGMRDGFTVSHPSTTTVNHGDALAALGAVFGARPHMGVVVTEREIEAAVSTGEVSARLRRVAPWMQEQFTGRFASWKPTAELTRGEGDALVQTGFKRPDMLLVRPGQPPTPVELELTRKSSVKEYARMLQAYDRAVLLGEMSSPVLYVVSEAAGTGPAIRTAIQNAVEETGVTLTVTIADLTREQWCPSERSTYFIARA